MSGSRHAIDLRTPSTSPRTNTVLPAAHTAHTPAAPAVPAAHVSRLRRSLETTRPPAIDLTGDDSDDEPVITGANIPRESEFARTMAELDRSIHRTQVGIQALQEPSPPRAPIRLGGAVLRTGNRQVHYEPLNPISPTDPNHYWLRSLLRNNDWFGPGPSAPPENAETITARVQLPKFDPAPPGYTSNFEVKSISLDENGTVIADPSPPYLACVSCSQPLLHSGQGERVYGLRCGHLIDAKCLASISHKNKYPCPACGRIHSQGGAVSLYV